jgi:uncharacterized protein YbcI
MNTASSGMAQRIARAVSIFEQRLTGHAPTSATAVLSDDTLVVSLQGALSPAERALAQSAEGAAQVQEFHRELFANSLESLRQEIQRITGVAVREGSVDVETGVLAFTRAFRTGTVVHVFLLAESLPTEAWSGPLPEETA